MIKGILKGLGTAILVLCALYGVYATYVTLSASRPHFQLKFKTCKTRSDAALTTCKFLAYNDGRGSGQATSVAHGARLLHYKGPAGPKDEIASVPEDLPIRITARTTIEPNDGDGVISLSFDRASLEAFRIENPVISICFNYRDHPASERVWTAASVFRFLQDDGEDRFDILEQDDYSADDHASCDVLGIWRRSPAPWYVRWLAS